MMEDLSTLFWTPTCIALVLAAAVCVGLVSTVREEAKILRLVRLVSAARALLLLACLLAAVCGGRATPADHYTALMRVSGRRLAACIAERRPGARVAVLLAPESTACRRDSLAVLDGLRSSRTGSLKVTSSIDFPSLSIVAQEETTPGEGRQRLADQERVEAAFSAGVLERRTR